MWVQGACKNGVPLRFHAIAEIRQNGKPSTADPAAAARAGHQRDRVRIFEDPYAQLLCGRFWRLVLRIRPLEWFLTKGMMRPIRPVSMCVLMRARYAEQALETAVKDGITQYVIIGAGMDSFAFRRPDLMGSDGCLRDRPSRDATQEAGAHSSDETDNPCPATLRACRPRENLHP